MLSHSWADAKPLISFICLNDAGLVYRRVAPCRDDHFACEMHQQAFNTPRRVVNIRQALDLEP